MLKQLNIRGFAVIDELELPFAQGMTVLTGETGAGKSILVDALGLILGDRADSDIIREKHERTELTAIFELGKENPVTRILEDQALSTADNELLIRRVINRDGRSRAFINNSPVTAQLLRDIGEHLIDIHGQHAHQSLTKRDIQRELLDENGGYGEQLTAVMNAYQAWHGASTRLAALTGENRDQDAAISLLRYQVQELEALQPGEDEYERLNEEHKRLANANRLLETGRHALMGLREDDHSIHTRLHQLIKAMRELEKFDESLNGLLQTLDEAAIGLSEAGDELRAYLAGITLDPARLQEVEKRLTDLHDMARKHQVHPQQLAGHLAALQQQHQALENSQQLIGELQLMQQQALEQYGAAAASLRQSRQKAAAKMGKAITGKLHELGMPNGKFMISVEPEQEPTPRPHGLDKIEFLVNINPGQKLLPLRKVASGGELSRISLAIQVIGSNDKAIPTLVFDEVDAGIGGGVAEIVGKSLHKLAGRRQVFCVTHLPQVASQGDHHFKVQKSSSRSSTQTQVSALNVQERIEEIARMLGGVKVTEQSRKHAEEMLAG